MAGILFHKADDMMYTQIHNTFIDTYMPGANPVFSLIYIYAIRHINHTGLTLKDFEDTFHILESDVKKAFAYWEKEKLLKINEEDGDFTISFLSVAAKTAAKAVKVEEGFGKPPKYSAVELEMYKTTYDEINHLFAYAEKALGKLLSANDLSILYSFYDWLRLSVDVIEFLLDYCAQNNHRRIKYIEAVALDWAENGISSVEQAKEYINLFNKDYRDILKASGITGRNPAPKEIEFIKKWQSEYEMPIEIILEACDKTILALGKAQFSYTDKILEGWHKAGAKNLNDVKKIEIAYKNTNTRDKEIKTAKKAPPKRTNRFVNYEQHTRDYDKIEKLESEYLLNSLKGKKDE